MNAFNRHVNAKTADGSLSIKRKDDQHEMPTYEIFRSKTKADMDSDERCYITLLGRQNINNSEIGKITIKPEKHSWFVEAGRVSIKENSGTDKPLGTLMMVSPNNVHLIKENEAGERNSPDAQDQKIPQLLEMIPASCRQACLYKQYEIPGMPGPVGNNSDPDSANWPLLDGFGEKYIGDKEGLPKSVQGVVNDMGSLAEVIASMHEKGIAHDDIKPGNLCRIDGRVGPGNPERFSVVGVHPGPDRLGEKRFTFYNNAWHAPELRFPGEADDKHVWPEPECRFQRETGQKDNIQALAVYTRNQRGGCLVFRCFTGGNDLSYPGGQGFAGERGSAAVITV